jgi:hypothetical protein
MDKSRIHLVPIQIIDLAESALDTSKQAYQRDVYLARLQAIRDYTTEIINKYQVKKEIR